MKSTGRGEDAVREDYRQEFGISRFGKVEDLGSLIAFLASTHGRWLAGPICWCRCVPASSSRA